MQGILDCSSYMPGTVSGTGNTVSLTSWIIHSGGGKKTVNRWQVNTQYDRERFLLPRNSKQGKRHKVLLLDIRKPGKPHWEGCIWADWSKPRRYQSVAMREQTGPSPWDRTVCGCWRPDKEAGAAGAC